MNITVPIVVVTLTIFAAPIKANAVIAAMPCLSNYHDQYLVDNLDFDNYAVQFRHKWLPIKCTCYLGSGGDVVFSNDFLDRLINEWRQENDFELGVSTSVALPLQNEQCSTSYPEFIK